MRAAILAFAACCAAWAAPPEPSRWRLVFSDEFEGAALDTAKWNYRTGPRMWSEQRPENVSVSGGMLRIALKREKAGQLDYNVQIPLRGR